ncbi:MAG: AAA family ATPase [Minisyncoccia bacterium]
MKKEILTKKERIIQGTLLEEMKVEKRKTKKSVIIAMIGLVGSGKSTVAQELAKHIGAIVISSDHIRVALREQGEEYKHVRLIAENVVFEAIARGSNAVMDSDFIDAEKRAIIRGKARKVGVRLVFIRVYCDFDTMIGRTISMNFLYGVDDFFGGASSSWKGLEGHEHEWMKGTVVKIREMWRRTSQHYRSINKGGGQWIIKKPPCAVLANIDTTDLNSWKREVEKCAGKLLSL